MIVEAAQFAHQHAATVAYSPNLIYAYTKVIAEQVCLVVYRSVAVKLRHELYIPVTRFLAENEHEQVSEVFRDDENMIRQRGVETTYAIHGRRDDPSNPQLKRCA